MIISNFKNLARNSFRRKVLLAVEAGYQAIEIPEVVKNKIKIKNNKLFISGEKFFEIDLNNYQRIFLIGVGKGSALACFSIMKILGKKLSGGIALDIKKPKNKIQNSKFKFFVGTHPVPSKKNVKASQEIIKLTKNLNKNDLLINFICGGGSALLCCSDKELKYSRTIFKKLTSVGADIFELNTIRKHISKVKGGGLAKLAYPATVISLIVSDILGNDISMVASGPTVFDKTTKKEAKKVIKKYQIFGVDNELLETPKEKKYFKKVKNILFLSNKEPIKEIEKEFCKKGFKTEIHSLRLKGEAEKSLLPLMKKAKKNKAILAAGETTVTLIGRPKGKGGRNTEAVLGALARIEAGVYKNKFCLLSLASDGRDNSEAAGVIADELTVKNAKKLKLETVKFLKENNSFVFFQKTKDLIFINPKTFNVADFMIVIKKD
ncbi:DUF4147 domain-containing protein [Candidatus Wolfebacteria bacterium]|nr:DUF4147 domain-containing protein [Candidatus Wolfebacteria bacterium]